jgi:hypothetical protein
MSSGISSFIISTFMVAMAIVDYDGAMCLTYSRWLEQTPM